MNPKSRILLTTGGFWSFLAFGFVDNLKGPLLPEIVRSGFDYAQAGSLVLASYLGFVLATLTTGWIADRRSNALVMWISGVCLMLGGFGVCIWSDYTWSLLCLGLAGYGLGAIELGANALMIELHSQAPGRYLNLLSVFHGCGSLIVPMVAAGLITQAWRWQIIYALSGFLALPLLCVFWSGLFSARRVVKPASSQVMTANVSVWRVGFTPIMVAYYVMIGAYVAVELSTATWMMEHLQVTHGLSVDVSSRYLSAFFAMLMMGRLLGAAVVDRFDYLMVVLVCLILAGACLAAAIFGPAYFNRSWLLYLFPLSGLCMSVTFPTITASVSQLHRGQSATVMGWLFAFGGVGGALGPWLVGMISKRLGLTHGLSAVLLFDVLAIAAWLWIRHCQASHPTHVCPDAWRSDYV